MKDWATLEPDLVLLVPTTFTVGRGGAKIEFVVVHHNAGTLSAQQIYNVWAGGRAASAHYQVDRNGIISQHVWDKDTAWHAADSRANAQSIGIEHANGAGITGPLTEATLDNGAHLTAAVCVRYGLGRPVWGKNVIPHNKFAPTACPGPLGGEQRDAYMARAQMYYDQMTGVTTAPPTQEDEVTPQDKQDIITGVVAALTKDINFLGAVAERVWKAGYGPERDANGERVDTTSARLARALNASEAALGKVTALQTIVATGGIDQEALNAAVGEALSTAQGRVSFDPPTARSAK